MWARLIRGYDHLVTGLGLLAGAIFAAMALGIGIDVTLRNVAGSGVGWLIEIMEYAMLAATMLAAPWVLREGSHVTVDVLVSRLTGVAGLWVRALAALLGLLICATMLHYSWRATALAIERGSMVFKSIVFPEWWVTILVPAGMALLTLEFLRLFLGALAARTASRSLEA